MPLVALSRRKLCLRRKNKGAQLLAPLFRLSSSPARGEPSQNLSSPLIRWLWATALPSTRLLPPGLSTPEYHLLRPFQLANWQKSAKGILAGVRLSVTIGWKNKPGNIGPQENA